MILLDSRWTRRAAWMLLALTVAACGGGSGGADTGPVAFVVTQVVPFAGADNISLREEINIVLTRSVDAESLSPQSVRVVSESNVEIIGERLLSQFNPAIIRFIPLVNYQPDEIHNIEVTQEVLDASGQPLEQIFTATFRAEESPPELPGPQQTENLGNRMVLGRWFHRMTLLSNGRFLVTGGYAADNSVRNQAELLVIVNRQTSLIPTAMRSPRAGHVQIQLDDGRVLLAGGEAATTPFLPLRSCETFDPSTTTFAETGAMEFARSFADATRLPDGRILVTGGQSEDASGTFIFRDDAEIFDPLTDTWTTVTTLMERGRAAHASATLPSGNAIVFGGSSTTASANRFSLATEQFLSSPAPNFPHFFAAHTQLTDGTVVVAGGSGTNGISIFREGVGFVGALNTLPSERIFATATAFEDGRVLIIGGFNSTTFPALIHSTLDVFVADGPSGRVFRAPDFRLPVPTSHHASARDHFGAVWVTGGLPLDVAGAARRQVTIIHPE